jgi:hypothetical protein
MRERLPFTGPPGLLRGWLPADQGGDAIRPPELSDGQRPRQPGWRAVSTWLGLGALAFLLAVVGGPMVLAVPLAVVLVHYLPRWCGWVAFAAMTVAGVLTALAAHPALAGTGAFGAPAQAFALVALTIALVPTLPSRASAA